MNSTNTLLLHSLIFLCVPTALHTAQNNKIAEKQTNAIQALAAIKHTETLWPVNASFPEPLAKHIWDYAGTSAKGTAEAIALVKKIKQINKWSYAYAHSQEFYNAILPIWQPLFDNNPIVMTRCLLITPALTALTAAQQHDMAWQTCSDKPKCLFLFNNGININSKSNSGNTLLYKAAKNQHVDITNFLLMQKANVTIANKTGSTPLLAACERGNRVIVEALLKSGANANIADNVGYTPLHEACDNGNIEIVKLLLHSSANVNAITRFGTKPLTCATFSGHTEIADLLREHGAHK